MDTFVNHSFRLSRMTLLFFSLIALACLPIALSSLVRDASVRLLLPLTLLGALLAWVLAQSNVRGTSSGIVLVVLGPLALFIRTGQLGRAISALVRETFVFIESLYNFFFQETPLDPSGFVSASNNLTDKFLTLGSRMFTWAAGLWQGIHVEDPLIRMFAWSLLVWLIAVWGGWQISRNKRLLVGMIPTTISIALVLDYSNKEIWIFWAHISLLVFLYGLNGFVTLQKRWEFARVDYSDSTQLETLLTVGALTLGLVTVSAFGSKVSVKDILDDLRERRESSTEARTDALGLEAGGGGYVPSGIGSGISKAHTIGPGPRLSDDVVMLIATGDLPPMPSATVYNAMPNYYWRSITYEHYTGSGWTNPSPFAEDILAEQSLIEPPYENYRLVQHEITLANRASEQMYWAGTLVSAEVPFQALWIRKAGKDQLLESDLLAALAPAESYRVDSLLADVSADELRRSTSVYPDWVRNRFLALPDSVPERVRALGRDLSASGKTPYDRALAIQNYLREFPYSLDVPAPPPGREAADYFLFDLKQGYCDYYATTMVVLARAAGLPARIVMGYTGAAYDSQQARYIVAEKNAHAWVEIYFTDIGWVEFEPTANQPIIAYSESGSAQVIVPPAVPQAPSTSPVVILLERALDLAWIPVIVLFLSLLLWIGWDALRFARLGPAQAIQILYRRLRRIARPVSGSLSRGQTAHEYASLLEARISSLEMRSGWQDWPSHARDEIMQLTEIYARSLFAPQSPTPSEAQRAIRVWSRLRWRMLWADALALKNRLVQLLLRKRA